MENLPGQHGKELDQLPHSYWWHIHRIALASDKLLQYAKNNNSQKIRYVDVGGGTGQTSLLISNKFGNKAHTSVNVFCIEGDETLKPLQENKPIQFLRFDLENSWPTLENKFHLVTILDVLEHLENPVQSLKKAQTILDSNAIGVITVPAFQFLFSDWDKKLHHKRRYTRNLLKKQCQEAGFDVLWSSYFYSYALIPALALRKFVKTTNESAEFPKVHPLVNSILKFCGILERFLLKISPLPFGTSVIMVIRKP